MTAAPGPVWLKDPLGILAEGAARGIVVADGVIVELVPSGGAPRRSAAVFDAGAHVVLPGLINAHDHLFQNLTRAFAPSLNKPLFAWLAALLPVWVDLRPAELDAAVRLGAAELLLSGCTTTSDHHYVFTDTLPDPIDIAVAALREMGLRAVVTRGSIDLRSAESGLPGDRLVQDADAILADSERLITANHQAGAGAMVQIALAPGALFSATADLFTRTQALARRHGVRCHTHLGETTDEIAYCRDAHGCRPVEFLERTGWLADNVCLAHGIHFDDGEVARLGAAGVAVAHCPDSNIMTAAGTCPVPALEAAGVAVGLGVDGGAAAGMSNPMQQARQAFLVQRLRHGIDGPSHTDALRWATRGGARCLGRDDLGEIAVGKQADLALFRLDEPRFSGYDDPLAALVMCGAHRADRVMVQGRWVVEHGAIPGLDLAALQARHQQAATALMARNR